jgi:hypothetical protein
VDAALVVYALDLHNGFVGRCLQHTVVAATATVLRIHRATKGRGPEPGSLVHIGGLAVDQHGAKAGMMHIDAFICK